MVGPGLEVEMALGGGEHRMDPYHKNTKKSMERLIPHTFKEDFYGEIPNAAIVAYLKPEKNFI